MVKDISLPNHEKEAGKHRDPLDRRRLRTEAPVPEVLGRDIIARLQRDKDVPYGETPRER